MAEANQPQSHPREQQTQPPAAVDERNGSNGNAPDTGENEQDVDQVPLYRRKRILIPVFILLLAGVGAWWYWYTSLRGFTSTDDAYIDANRVSVSSKILGRIVSLAADETDTVRQGEIIVRLDDSDLKAQAAQAGAALVSAQQNVSLAQVNLAKAVDDFRRAETQFRNNVIPKEQFDHAQKALDAARAQQAISNAQVGSAKAQLGVIQTQLQNTAIVSPMTGIVSKRWVLPGDIVQAAQPIYSVYDIQHIWVTANFEETKLSSIHLGDTVQVSVDAYPDLAFWGKVYQLGSNTASQFSLIPPNNASGNYTKVTQRVPVKISIDGASQLHGGHALLPGMSVEVKIRERK